MTIIKDALAKIAQGEILSRNQARDVFSEIMSGEASDAQIGGLLMGLRLRGEHVDELIGAVGVMRDKMTRVVAPDHAVDIVGTGGDGKGSYNISTAAAFVVAGAGVPVAKHGNRALSSHSGAADVLEALGVQLLSDAEKISSCIQKTGLGFMFAPHHHQAMKYVGNARKELGIRTIFNLLGPMSNPAGARYQLLGVFSAHWLEPMAMALQALGSEHVWVVHGQDGMDELSLCAPSSVVELYDGNLRSFTIDPRDYGFDLVGENALQGGDASHNATALLSVLRNEDSAYKNSVLLNAGAALLVAGKADDLEAGIDLARDVIAQGQAMAVLDRVIEASHG